MKEQITMNLKLNGKAGRRRWRKLCKFPLKYITAPWLQPDDRPHAETNNVWTLHWFKLRNGQYSLLGSIYLLPMAAVLTLRLCTLHLERKWTVRGQMTIKQKEPAVPELAAATCRQSSCSKRTTVRTNDLRKGNSEPLRSGAIYVELQQYLSNPNN